MLLLSHRDESIKHGTLFLPSAAILDTSSPSFFHYHHDDQVWKVTNEKNNKPITH